MTIRQLIEWGAQQFEEHGLVYQHGTDNAMDESAALVLHALSFSYDQPDSVLDDRPSVAGAEHALGLLQERIRTRRPAAYLLNQAWFAGIPFYVDERVLVPRSPIAQLVESRFSPWIKSDNVHRVLDLCTGSGCIGIACAVAFPLAQVTATDISTDALAVARKNVQQHGLTERVQLVAADVFAGLTPATYNIIVSNPPYVPQSEYDGLAAEFTHEPGIGLVAGSDGLAIVTRILADAPEYLCPGGILIVEVGYTRETLIEQYPDIPFLWLEFECGGEGVFLLNYSQLVEYRQLFESVTAGRGARRAETLERDLI